MQSGITASQELRAAFQELVSTPGQRGLIATIAQEQLVPKATLASTSGDFFTDVGQLSAHVTPTEALYVILRRYEGAAGGDAFVAVTYVPDAAPVRQKMLFASTRLTLVRELGTERFRESIFATTPQELTADGFRTHDAHAQLQAPLTEEEESLGEVKRLEAENGLGMTATRSHVKNHMGFPIADDALAALKALAESASGDNLVQLKIDLPTETILLVSTSEAAAASLAADISNDEGRYSFFKYQHTHAGEVLAPIVFIYSCPSNSKVKERMAYALSRRTIVAIAESQAGMTVDKKLEVTNPDELTAEGIDLEFHPKVETKKAFDRPKRPGRR